MFSDRTSNNSNKLAINKLIVVNSFEYEENVRMH